MSRTLVWLANNQLLLFFFFFFLLRRELQVCNASPTLQFFFQPCLMKDVMPRYSISSNTLLQHAIHWLHFSTQLASQSVRLQKEEIKTLKTNQNWTERQNHLGIRDENNNYFASELPSVVFLVKIAGAWVHLHSIPSVT